MAVEAVFQFKLYGPVVISEPRLAPSSLNCTPAMPTLSDAVAATDVLPETVEPFTGAVTETEGGVVSGVGGATFDTVTFTVADVFVLPAASRARAVSA